jgi:hypothetical protein
MLAVLLPLHEKMERQGPTTLKEIAFVQVCAWGGVPRSGPARRPVEQMLKGSAVPSACLPALFGPQRRPRASSFFLPPPRLLPQAYGRELSEAYEWLSKYRASRKEAELHQVGAPTLGLASGSKALGATWPTQPHPCALACPARHPASKS